MSPPVSTCPGLLACSLRAAAGRPPTVRQPCFTCPATDTDEDEQ